MELIDRLALKADIKKRVTQYRHGDKPMPTIEDIIDEQLIIRAVPVSATQDEDFRIASEVRMAVGCNTAKECWELARNGDIQVVKHGRWVKNEDRSGWHCSCCGKDDLYAYPYTENNERELQDFYCPNCGAKMGGGENG